MKVIRTKDELSNDEIKLLRKIVDDTIIFECGYSFSIREATVLEEKLSDEIERLNKLLNSQDTYQKVYVVESDMTYLRRKLS